MEDANAFFNFLRMEPAMFDELLQRVGPRIQKKDTGWRKALEPDCTTLLLRFYYDHQDLSTMLPRCLYDYGASVTLF
jgi:hypothetical protein